MKKHKLINGCWLLSNIIQSTRDEHHIMCTPISTGMVYRLATYVARVKAASSKKEAKRVEERAAEEVANYGYLKRK